jgi:4a-hydroxytetrahydrobiopterin dehydratase
MALRDEVIPTGDLAARLGPLEGWAGDTAGISKEYPIGWDAAVLMVAEVGPLAVELAHRPDMDVRWTGLRVFLTTHTAGDVVTELDLVTAARLDAIAAGYGSPGV